VPGEQLTERSWVSRDVCLDERGVVARAFEIRAFEIRAIDNRSFEIRAHDLTEISVISPRKPPETSGSWVSQTSR